MVPFHGGAAAPAVVASLSISIFLANLIGNAFRVGALSAMFKILFKALAYAAFDALAAIVFAAVFFDAVAAAAVAVAVVGVFAIIATAVSVPFVLTAIYEYFARKGE